MTGTEKILRHIADQAENESRQILDEARAQAAKLTEKADAQVCSLKEEGEAKAEVFLKDAQERVEAATAMQKRRALLAAKGELVNEALKAAYQKLLNLPDEEYFAFLYRQLARQELKGNGELCLNQKDYARRPADFDAKVSAAAAEKGGTLRVSDQPAAIDGGFILSYGGIMENCSFEAVFESEADRMKDRIREVLFQN